MRLRSAAVSIAVLLFVGAVGAQGSWSSHTNAGEYAFARGDFRRAESEFRAALEIAQGFPDGDRRLETSLQTLARLYEHESDFDHAQPMYQLLLAAKEARLGTEDPALLNTLFAVARVSQPVGDLPTVVESLQHFASIAQKSGKADPRQHWQALQMLARMETVQEHDDEALQWQQRAAAVIFEDPKATIQERIDLLLSLAEMELVAEEGSAAESIYNKVAELRRAKGEAAALSHTMAQGAETALAAAELETAERLAMQALNASPDTTTELQAHRVLAELSWIKVNRGTDDMATLLAAAGDSEELVLARDRLRSLSELEGDSDPTTLTRLAQVEALRGKPGSAADWQRRLLDLVADDPGTAAVARRDLVTLLSAAGRYDEALTENAAMLADLEARYGSMDRLLMPVLGQRLHLYDAAGKKKQAKKIRKRMKKISKQ
jgi:tetratricopeptide (TPR) repeat protein